MELKHSNSSRVSELGVLLIVPYGIETAAYQSEVATDQPFNRTLWN